MSVICSHSQFVWVLNMIRSLHLIPVRSVKILNQIKSRIKKEHSRKKRMQICSLHRPSMLDNKAKINRVLYIQSSFKEPSSYWSEPKKLLISQLFICHHTVSLFFWYWSAFRNHEGSTLKEKDRNELNYWIRRGGPYHRSRPNHRIGQGWLCWRCIAGSV